MNVDKTNVTDTATLAGTVRVAPIGPVQFATPYTILTAANGLVGQFGGATGTGLSVVVENQGNDVILTMAPNLAGESGLNLNQKAVGQVLDRAMTAAGNSLGFHGLFALTPSQFAQGLSQLSGELGTAGGPAALLSMHQFLSLMLDPFAGTRGDEGGAGPALGFAQDRRTPAQATEAYAAFRPFYKAPVATPLAYQDRWTAWGAAYGSHSRADGDGFVGSHDRTVRTGHIAGGFERRISPDAVIGFALSGGSANFRLGDGLGSGRGDILQGGFYGAWRFDSYYLAGSLAASYYDVTSDRIVSLGVASQLDAAYNATGFGARIEGGRRFIKAGYGVTPFVAVQAQTVRTDAYSERVVGGSPLAALSYNAETTSRLRTELGVTFDRRFGEVMGGTLHWYTRIAWVHEFWRDNSIVAAFQSLPGSGFTVAGAAPATNAALLAAGAQLQFRQRMGGARQARRRVRQQRHHLQRQRDAAKSLVARATSPRRRSAVQLRRRRQRFVTHLRLRAADAEHVAHRRHRRVGHRRVTFRGRMDGAAVDRGQHAPDRIVDAGRGRHAGKTLRIGHGGEVAVVRGAHPARPRRIGTVLAGRPAAGERIARRARRIGAEGVAGAREAGAVEFRILLRARADAVLRERGLMRVDEGHALGAGIAAELAVAHRDGADLRQEFVGHELHHVPQPLRIGAEGRMHVEAAAPAGAGRVRRGQRGMAVGNEHDAREIAADQRLERGAQLQRSRSAGCCRGCVATPGPSRCGRCGRTAAVRCATR